MDLNPFHEAECQTAVVQEEARKCLCFAIRPFIHGESLGSCLLLLKRPSERDNEKSKKQFYDFISHDFISHLCSKLQTRATYLYLTAFAPADMKRKKQKAVVVLYITLYTVLSSVLLYDLVRLYVVYPAVLAAADGIVLTDRQATQTKLNQDNFLLVSGGGGGAGPHWTFTDKDRQPRLDFGK